MNEPMALEVNVERPALEPEKTPRQRNTAREER